MNRGYTMNNYVPDYRVRLRTIQLVPTLVTVEVELDEGDREEGETLRETAERLAMPTNTVTAWLGVEETPDVY